MNIRCWLGLHKWDAWEQGRPGAKAPAVFSELLVRVTALRRKCLRCGSMEYVFRRQP